MRTVLARVILAGFTTLVVATTGASAAPDPGGHSLSTTVRISLTIAPSATIGRVDSGSSASFFVRDPRGEDMRPVVQVVFTDGRGERTLQDAQDIMKAIREAERAGDEHADVTFVF